LEEQAENAKARDLFWKPLSKGLLEAPFGSAFGRRVDLPLWETFFTSLK
jgi:hypothetical protein